MRKQQKAVPVDIIATMLDHVKYIPQDGDRYRICQKHIIDTNCEEGDFLEEIVERYVQQGRLIEMEDANIVRGLETYVHGLSIEPKDVFDCRCRLDKVAARLGLGEVAWDVTTDDALEVGRHDGKMSIVVGCPPRTRIKTLAPPRKKIARRLDFSKHAAAELYLSFLERSMALLADKGVVTYVTPPAWVEDSAGLKFREFLLANPVLYSIIDMTDRNVFDARTGATVITLVKGAEPTGFWYQYWNGGGLSSPVKYNLQDCVRRRRFIFDPEEVRSLNMSYLMRGRDGRFKVKNGFVTLNDKAFISDNIDFESGYVIDIIRAVSAERHKAIFPYTPEGDPVPFPDLDMDTKRWLTKRVRKEIRKSRPLRWWLYGKTQAVRDVCVRKFSLGPVAATPADVKILEAPAGCGVYSGFYILAPDDVNREELERVLATEDFIAYIKQVGKPQKYGRFRFTNLDVEKYLNQRFYKTLTADNE